MSEYFENFPTMEYQGYKVRDIMRLTKIVEDWDADPFMFLPYTVQGDEKAEDVAYLYYGDPHLVWLVYLANGVKNPYEDWVMGYDHFKQYLTMKYKKASNKTTEAEIIAWTEQRREFYVNAEQHRITPYTYDYSPDINQVDWSLVTTYAYEEWKNESKRNIRLINSAMADQAISQLKEKLNGR